jgi:hypothetical protein|tara:strand:- start:1667 stop:2146 length:480 start_codon:yes stop_codon:yes gene_type:complete
MNDDARLKLKNMINEFNPEETTEKIRTLRHSEMIKTQVNTYLQLKKQYGRVSKETFGNLSRKKCEFLYTNYTNLYNKLIKDELDLNILFEFIDILKQIEVGKLDQHEASVKVGQILKELYIDSALREDKKRKNKDRTYRKEKTVSWNDFKQHNMHLTDH